MRLAGNVTGIANKANQLLGGRGKKIRGRPRLRWANKFEKDVKE